MTSPMDTHEGLPTVEELAIAMWENTHDGRWDDPYCNDENTRAIYRGDAEVALELMSAASPSPELPAGGIMAAAEKAAKRVSEWSDAKKDYAGRVTGALPAPAPHAEVRDMTDKATTWDVVSEKNAEIVRLRNALRDIADGYGANHGSKFARDKASAALAPQPERGKVGK